MQIIASAKQLTRLTRAVPNKTHASECHGQLISLQHGVLAMAHVESTSVKLDEMVNLFSCDCRLQIANTAARDKA